jgi:hypothetical protein
MPTNIKDYSTTQASNTSLNGISVAEGMLPSNLNNAIRALMKNTREWFNDAQWIEYGDGDGAYTATYVSGTSFTISGVDVTAIYHASRRIKITASSPGTIYGTISSSSFSTNTTVNVTWDSGSLSNEAISNVYVAALSQTNDSIPENSISSNKLKTNAVTTAKIVGDAVTNAKIADDSIDSEHIVDGSIDTAHIADSNITTAKIADSNVTTAKIADSNVTTAKIADSNVTTAKINDNAVTAAKIADAVIVTNSEQSGHTPDDATFFTTSASDTRYFRQDSTETIDSGDTWSASDSFIATTAAIDARVIDLVDDVGGFFPIANETSFPNTNPDVNNGAGTIVSIQAISSTRTPTGGTVSISSGTVGGSTVTITGCGSTVLTAGFGVLVETTTTLNTYTFHRLTPKATEVTTVASISSNITTVAGDTTNIGTIATDLNGDDNIGTVATNITNVNNVGGSIANVNTVATNLSGVNSFAERYRVASSDPTTSLDEGDLAYNTSDNNLKFYNGSSWTSIAPGIANVVEDTSPQLGGNLDLNSNTINGTGNINITGTVTASTISGVLANVVEDTSPQLGGNLDVQTNQIVSTSNNNVKIYPNGTGVLEVGGDGSSNDGAIQLNCSQNSHGVKIQSPAHSAGQSYTLILPTSVGNANQVLATNGNSTNQLSWIDAQETKPTVANVSQTIAPATATTISITGTNFVSIPTVEFVNGSTGAITNSNTVSFTNATTLSVNVTLASGNYYVRIENPDGNAGRSTNNIITASTAPSFSTAAGSLGTIAGNFSGTVATVAGSSDSSITFSEVTSVLTNASQANCTLNSSTGVITTSDFGGSSTTPTTYNFTLRITDAEAQTVDRAFSLTSSFGATGGAQFN